jgi:hypothetical protein
LLVKRTACFAAAITIAAILAGPALARIGVTSVADGATSVTQGTDLQAGQRINTGPDGRAHLMFLDGTAVTVGPNSALQIDKYSYDAASKTGAMSLNIEQGTIRFVGGAISKKTDVQIRTPSGTIGLRGGIAAIAVNADGRTRADFLHGSAMRVSAGGITQTATRSGSQINVVAGGQPSAPTVLAAGQLASIQSLDRAFAAPQPTSRTATPSIDDALKKSGLGGANSGMPRQPLAAANTALPGAAQRVTAQVQTDQIRQAGQQLATNQAVIPPVVAGASPIVNAPIPPTVVPNPVAAKPPIPTSSPATVPPQAPPPAPSTGGGAIFMSVGGTRPMPGTVPPGFTSGLVSVGR